MRCLHVCGCSYLVICTCRECGGVGVHFRGETGGKRGREGGGSRKVCKMRSV